MEAAFEYRTRAAGLIEARLRGDRFSADDRAVLELPAQPELAVTVCTDEPELLRPLLSSLPVLAVTTRSRAQCLAQAPQGVAVYDRFVPPGALKGPSLFLKPPVDRSPIPIANSGVNERIERWEQSHPLAAGLPCAGLPPHPGPRLPPRPRRHAHRLLRFRPCAGCA